MGRRGSVLCSLGSRRLCVHSTCTRAQEMRVRRIRKLLNFIANGSLSQLLPPPSFTGAQRQSAQMFGSAPGPVLLPAGGCQRPVAQDEHWGQEEVTHCELGEGGKQLPPALVGSNLLALKNFLGCVGGGVGDFSHRGESSGWFCVSLLCDLGQTVSPLKDGVSSPVHCGEAVVMVSLMSPPHPVRDVLHPCLLSGEVAPFPALGTGCCFSTEDSP